MGSRVMGPSVVTPMLISRPLRRNPPKADDTCLLEFVVDRTTSNPPASVIALPGSSPTTSTSLAPMDLSSLTLSAWPVTAQVSSPTACENCRARWPSPPSPSTATRSPGRGVALRRPLITVYPAQKMGAASS